MILRTYQSALENATWLPHLRPASSKGNSVSFQDEYSGLWIGPENELTDSSTITGDDFC